MRIGISLPTSSVPSIAFTLDGTSLAVADDTGRVWAVSVSDGNVTKLREAASRKQVSRVALSNDASLFVTVEREGAIVIWELPSGHRLQAFDFPRNYVGPLEISASGGWIATAAETDFVLLCNIANGSHKRLPTGFVPFAIAISPRGDSIASWSWGNHSPTVLDVASRQSSTPRTAGRRSGLEAAVFSPDGRLLATGAADGPIALWILETMELVTEIDGHKTRVGSLAFSPDSRMLVSGGDDHQVRLWDVASGAELATLESHRSTVRKVCVSSDGSILATCATADDGISEVFLWRATAAGSGPNRP